MPLSDQAVDQKTAKRPGSAQHDLGDSLAYHERPGGKEPLTSKQAKGQAHKEHRVHGGADQVGTQHAQQPGLVLQGQIDARVGDQLGQDERDSRGNGNALQQPLITGVGQAKVNISIFPNINVLSIS